MLKSFVHVSLEDIVSLKNKILWRFYAFVFLYGSYYEVISIIIIAY